MPLPTRRLLSSLFLALSLVAAGCATADAPDHDHHSGHMDADHGNAPVTTTPAVAKLKRALNADTQAALTPDAVLAELKAGNERFLTARMTSRDLVSQVRDTQVGQWPAAVVLGCIDSRVPPEIVFDQGIGDIFSARVAGNFATPELIGSIEFAVAVAGSRLIVVMGHTSCGAVKGACDNVELSYVTSLVKAIQPSVSAVNAETGKTCTSKNDDLVGKVAHHNAVRTVGELRTKSPIIADLEKKGQIKVIAAMYDVHTGRVEFIDDMATHSGFDHSDHSH